MTDTPPILIVGAGLAGLACAVQLHRAGFPVRILEAADRPGGRVRTESRQGFRIDRGFQVLNTAYPQTRSLLDLKGLNAGAFEPGAMVRIGHRWHRIADPLRRPSSALATLRAPIGTLSDKLRILRLRHHCGRGSTDAVWDRPAIATRDHLRSFGFSDQIIARFFQPFYGGVFLEEELRTSSRLFDFTFRMFASGRAVLPAGGIAAIPEQLAQRLPGGSIHTDAPVAEVTPDSVRLRNGESRPAAKVVVATDPDTATALLPSLRIRTRRWKSVTTVAFAARRRPVGRPWLLLNGNRPDDGPAISLCCPSAVAAGYAPAGQELVTATVLGTADPDQLPTAVRTQMANWFGPSVDSWETLAVLPVPQALPEFLPGDPDPIPFTVSPDGIYVIGDHLHHPSIEGAILSGIAAAEAISQTAPTNSRP